MRKQLAAIAIVIVATAVTWAGAAAYLIQPGDTLNRIARDNGTTVAELVQLNGIPNPDLIYAGDTLRLPNEPEVRMSAPHPRVWRFERISAGQLSDVGIGQCLLAAGFPMEDLAYWIAIGIAESSGLTGVHGDVNIQTGKWGPSVGVMQIRSMWAQRGTGAERDLDQLSKPLFNCKSAYQISKQATTSRPWGASKHHDNRYAQFMGRGEVAALELLRRS